MDGTGDRLRSRGLLQADSMTHKPPPQDGPCCPVNMRVMRMEPGGTQNERDAGGLQDMETDLSHDVSQR